MDSDTLERCQRILDYTFTNPSLLELALTHASVASSRVQSNERLEFLGDSVLGLVVCEALYSGQPGLMEGDMTKIKSSVVSRATCAAIADEAGISDLLVAGKGVGDRSGLPTSVSAAVLESIIGAIYLDGGPEASTKFILRCIGPHLEEALSNEHQKNYKSMLQQQVQRSTNHSPEYVVLDEKGPDHSKCFEVAVLVAGKQYRSAWGRNKKEAEQRAAWEALRELGLVEDADCPGT